MTPRRHMSATRRARVFESAGGLCHLCGQRIQAGQTWEVEHVRALGLLGTDDDSNLAPAHKSCHAPKTADDVARMAKAFRQRVRHIGARQSRNPMPGSKGSKWKKRMDGTVVLR